MVASAWAKGQGLRTTPRNFPGRSGTEENSVFVCSPKTVAASALFGQITDPRTLEHLSHMAPPDTASVSTAIEPPPVLNKAVVNPVGQEPEHPLASGI
jgi:aconitate hydratase